MALAKHSGKSTFEFEGDTLRVVCVGKNSAARRYSTAQATWKLQRRLPDGRWNDEMYSTLRNGATVEEAMARFGF